MNEPYRIRPSNLGRVALCPGSHALSLEAQAKRLEVNAYAKEAAEGQSLHALVHPRGNLSSLPEEDRILVLRCREYADAHMSRFVSEKESYHEYHVELHSRNGGVIFGGTLDHFAYGLRDNGHRTGIIHDWKTGRGTLHPELIDWQMKAYAAAILQDSNEGFGPALDSVSVYVYQPATGVEYHGEYADWRPLLAEIEEVIVKAEGGPRTPHPAACHYCPAKTICPEFRQTALTLRNTSPLATGQEIADALAFATLIEPWADGVRKLARDRLRLDPEAVPGYELATRNNRILKDPEVVYDAIKVLSQEEFLPCCKVQLGPLEKALKAKGVKIPDSCVETTITHYLKRKD